MPFISIFKYINSQIQKRSIQNIRQMNSKNTIKETQDKKQNRRLPLSTQQSSLSRLNQIMSNKNAFLQQKKNKELEHKMRKMKKKYNCYISEHQVSSGKLLAADSICNGISNIYRPYSFAAFHSIAKFCQSHLNGSAQCKQQTNKQNVNIYPDDQKNESNVRLFWLLLNKTIKISNKRTLNTIFSCIKKSSLGQINSKYSGFQCNIQNKETNGSEQNLRDMRILEYSNRPDVHLNVEQHSIDCELLELSVYQSRCEAHKVEETNQVPTHEGEYENKQGEHIRIAELQNKLKGLQAQMENKAKRYAKIKQNLVNQIQLNNLRGSNKNKSLQGSAIPHKSFISRNGNIQISPDVSSPVCYDEDVVNQPEDICEFIQRNKDLQEQADRVRETVQELICLSASERCINPDLIAILKEVKQILEPNPLGLSLIMD